MFRMAYYCFILTVHTAAAITLLHVVCIQLGHATLA